MPKRVGKIKQRLKEAHMKLLFAGYSWLGSIHIPNFGPPCTGQGCQVRSNLLRSAASLYIAMSLTHTLTPSHYGLLNLLSSFHPCCRYSPIKACVDNNHYDFHQDDYDYDDNNNHMMMMILSLSFFASLLMNVLISC